MVTATSYFDTMSPQTAVLWDRELRRHAVDLLSRQSPFLPPTKLLDRALAEQLVAAMPSSDLAEALRSDRED